MARYFKKFFLFPFPLTLALLLLSCQEGHEAGDLLGMWKREAVAADNQYVAFSGNIVLMRAVGEREVFGNFQHVGDSIFIQCYSINGDEADRTLVEETFDFKPFDNIRLRIATLNGDALVLTSKEKTWHFKAD
ncbi:MAG: lipocalin-like domain-containing protein [Prevotella sp.]|nr:lipocalin-like domain-containing protein [Prevotella sp.]MBR1839707.1 lipocalin-like domain-containing protein [Prevotella sp.]